MRVPRILRRPPSDKDKVREINMLILLIQAQNRNVRTSMEHINRNMGRHG